MKDPYVHPLYEEEVDDGEMDQIKVDTAKLYLESGGFSLESIAHLSMLSIEQVKEIAEKMKKDG